MTASKILTLVLFLIGLATIFFGIFHMPYDYDELLQLRSSWLVSQGLTPYKDFFEVHPPFFWQLLSPLIRLLGEDPALLIVYRLIGLLGHLAFIFALLKSFNFRAISGQSIICLGLLLLCLLENDNYRYIVEGRMDSWIYAIVFLSFHYFLRSIPTLRSRVTIAIVLGFSSLVVPKIILLAPIFALCESTRARSRGFVAIMRSVIAYVAGGVVGAAIALSLLSASGISIFSYFDFVFLYHLRFNNYEQNLSLCTALVSKSYLIALLLVVLSLVYGARSFRQATSPNWYQIAIAIFLLVQLVAVSPPYPQYSAPWILIASALVYSFNGGSQLGGGFREKIANCGIIFALVIASISQVRSLSPAYTPIQHNQVIRDLLNQTSRGDFVIADLSHHPLYRRDSFFVSLKTTDYSSPCTSRTEQILLSIPRQKNLMGAETLSQELLGRPPKLIQPHQPGDCEYLTPSQRSALTSYLSQLTSDSSALTTQ